mgnify:CR=1 FL=1
MIEISKEQAEELRHAVLAYLAARHPAALPPRAILRTVEKDVGFRFDYEALHSALEFLRGDGLAALTMDPLGSTPYWSSTTAGVRTWERL